jgi:membrane fusion protein (multidrug efflux system)
MPLIATSLGLAGCGKPPPPQQGGPQGDFPVSAVVARAEEKVVEDQILLVATLAAKEEVTLVSELDAVVTEITFEEGQAVNKDDFLFRFDSVQTEARVEEAEAAYRLAELSYERNQALLENQTISQQEYDQTEAIYHQRKADLVLARDELDKAFIAAPFDGVVGEREISVGQFVTRGRSLTRLIRVDPLEIVFDVPERHLLKLRSGLSVGFTADAFPDEAFSGEVVYIAPIVTERTRTVRVKADVANPRHRLKPGLFGELALVLDRRDNAVVIPEACITFQGDATTVVAVNADGKSEFRRVRVGHRFEGQAEILEGIGAGELVVVEGFQKMGPGMTVHAAPESERYGVAAGPLAAKAAAAARAAGLGMIPLDRERHEIL